MHKTFNKIILESADNKTILIEPIQFYMLNDHSVKYVIMYKLMYIDNQNPSSNIESTIPYYISNGVTNKLRANMLYPFMCYSNVNDIKTCPFNFNRFNDEIDDGTVSILLKYNIGKNIEVIDLEEELIEIFLKLLPQEERNTSSLEDHIERQKNSQPHGLTSIISRISNFIDFLICIMSETIINFDYNQEKDDILYSYKYAPLLRADIANDYTDMTILKVREDYTSFPSEFRLVIITILNKYSMLLLNNKLIKIESVHLESTLINTHTFNTIVDICNTEKTKLNIKNYINISNIITDLLINIIDSSDITLEPDKTDLKNIKNIIDIKAKISPDEIAMCNTLLKKWKANCFSEGFIPVDKKKWRIQHSISKSDICNELNSYTHNNPSMNTDFIELCQRNGSEWVGMFDETKSQLENILKKTRTEMVEIYKKKF